MLPSTYVYKIVKTLRIRLLLYSSWQCLTSEEKHPLLLRIRFCFKDRFCFLKFTSQRAIKLSSRWINCRFRPTTFTKEAIQFKRTYYQSLMITTRKLCQHIFMKTPQFLEKNFNRLVHPQHFPNSSMVSRYSYRNFFPVCDLHTFRWFTSKFYVWVAIYCFRSFSLYMV